MGSFLPTPREEREASSEQSLPGASVEVCKRQWLGILPALPRPSLPPWTPDTTLPKFQAKQGSAKVTVTQGEPMARHAPCPPPSEGPQRCCSHLGKGTIGKQSELCPRLRMMLATLPPVCPSHPQDMRREVAGAKLWFLSNR